MPETPTIEEMRKTVKRVLTKHQQKMQDCNYKVSTQGLMGERLIGGLAVPACSWGGKCLCDEDLEKNRTMLDDLHEAFD